VSRGRGSLVAAVVAALLLGGCTSSDQPAEEDRPAQPVGRTTGPDRTCPDLSPAPVRDDGLPDLKLPCLEDGPPVNLKDLRGTPLVLNVWAAWCTNCDREMPLFADAMDRAGDRLRFFGVHYKATRAQGRASEDDFGVPFPSAHDGDGDLTVTRLGAYAPPQTIFVAPSGKVVGRKVGEITSQDELDGLVEQYLGVRL
jgi:cytochrome c biogenesis protein CcmG, thiol:disulfide interchange protein DsbE